MALTTEQAKAILKPIQAAYEKALENGNMEAVGAFYAPDAVLIHKGKSCAYGREDIKKALADFTGSSETKVSNEVTEATSDYIVYKSVFKTKAKILLGFGPEFGGKSEQIFRKDGNKWLIIYDEFEEV